MLEEGFVLLESDDYAPFSPMFQSFFIGGFECSSHQLRNGTRLNLLQSTQHEAFAAQDFARLRSQGIQTIRTGVNWHTIEVHPYIYDFAPLRQYLKAVKTYDIQTIWDFCHYGYPNDLNIFSNEFIKRYLSFARAVAQIIAQETRRPFFICPINEISFWAWAGGDGGYLNPFVTDRSFELKQQLVRATLEAIAAIRETGVDVRFTAIDPIISILPSSDDPTDVATAQGHHNAQYQTWDMLCGNLCPELGGTPDTLDIIGVNYYSNNQWVYEGPNVNADHKGYRLFSSLARDVYERYRRPMFIAETGIEGDQRPLWLRDMVMETLLLLNEGVPIHGLCLYPILDYPGWDDDRHCPSGLWGNANNHGERPIYQPLADELRIQQERMEQFFDLAQGCRGCGLPNP
jgi:beta-glucosidase/6-phospho-beta-glucosidase/beta-galactosidase